MTLLVASAFFISAHVGNFFAADGRTAAPIFPGAGAALAVLILAGRHYWPTIVVGRLFAFWVAAADRPFGLLVGRRRGQRPDRVDRCLGYSSAGVASTLGCRASVTCCGSRAPVV